MSGRNTRLLIIVGVAILFAGCAEIRKITYPPEITYIEQSKLEGVMHRMAAAMYRLDILIASETGEPEQQDILAQLDAIDRYTGELSGGKTVTNHLVLDEHMDKFSADVAKARLMAKASPPNYYYAGRLSGSCSGCHRFR